MAVSALLGPVESVKSSSMIGCSSPLPSRRWFGGAHEDLTGEDSRGPDSSESQLRLSLISPLAGLGPGYSPYTN